MQEGVSIPVAGFTVTETSALTPLRHAAQMKMKSDAATFGCVFLDVNGPPLPDFILVRQSGRARRRNRRESASKKGMMNLAIKNSAKRLRESVSGDGTTSGELLATKISKSVVSHADELL